MFETDAVTVDFQQPAAVFPLRDAVLLPHSVMPLHIFEPRYCRMVSDALDSVGFIAMGVFRGEVADADYLTGRPPLRRCACLGYIRAYETLSEGRFLLLLQGIARVRLTDEIEHEPYRIIRLQPLLEEQDDAGLARLRERMAALLDDPFLAGRKGFGQVRAQMSRQIDDEVFIDIAVAALCADPEQRYQMLKEPSPAARGEWVIRRLEAVRDAVRRSVTQS